jgi:type IV fimbrial biogenesis protein FimT
MKSQRGLTLIELVIVLAIVATLSGLAASALSSALEASRASAARGDLVASLRQAITRAELTGSRSVLCPSIDGEHCANDPDWSQGWLVFTDRNGNREFERDERLLHRQPALPGRVRLRSTAGRTRIVFQGYASNAGTNVTYTLCDGRGPARAVTLVMANTGRLRDGVPSADAIAATCPP